MNKKGNKSRCQAREQTWKGLIYSHTTTTHLTSVEFFLTYTKVRKIRVLLQGKTNTLTPLHIVSSMSIHVHGSIEVNGSDPQQA